MSATTDKQIADILATYGEPLAGNVWRVQGTAVIYHKTLERLAAQAQIAFAPPQILRAERDEAVILVTGEVQMANDGGVRREWSIGEALIGVNYRVSGKQAAYVFAMAEKRAKDRVILKLIGLHGLLYSEDEADEFKPTQETREQTRRDAGEPRAARDNPNSRDAQKPHRPEPGTPEWREALFKRARAEAALGNTSFNSWWHRQSDEAQAALEAINDDLDAIINGAVESRDAAE
jgi:hypothetical protein